MAVAPGYENMSDFIKVLPVIFEDRGTVIYKGRNELREFDIAGQKVVVKSFQIPHLLNRIIYNFSGNLKHGVHFAMRPCCASLI